MADWSSVTDLYAVGKLYTPLQANTRLNAATPAARNRRRSQRPCYRLEKNA